MGKVNLSCNGKYLNKLTHLVRHAELYDGKLEYGL